MSDTPTKRERQLAVRIASNATPAERKALRCWIRRIIDVKESDLSPLEKARQAVLLTADSKILLPSVRLIGQEVTPREVSQLVDQLQSIANSDLSTFEKIQRATSIALTQLKLLVWDNRSLPARAGIAAAIAAVVLFGGQGAGIAALGTAIGVPLWVVFGAGAAFLTVLYEYLSDDKLLPKTRYRIIDAEPETRGSRRPARRSSSKKRAQSTQARNRRSLRRAR